MLFLAAVATQAAIYKESGGRVLIEAEHFDVRTANADTHIWQIMPDENGAPFTAADLSGDPKVAGYPHSGDYRLERAS